MSPAATTAHPPAAPARRSKASTACNTCRGRKTRCDGERPTCSYCRSTRSECVYRATETSASLNEQQTVMMLERLDRMELRLESMASNSVNTNTPRWPWTGTEDMFAQISSTSAPSSSSSSLSQTPPFHTASSHKMLHYWPRINMAVTLLDTSSPLRYVEDTASGGVGPTNNVSISTELNTLAIQRCFVHMHETGRGLDYLLGQLLQRHTNVLSLPIDTSSPTISVNSCNCQLLLAISLASRGTPGPSASLGETAFRAACAKIGELFFTPDDDDSVLFLIVAAHLFMARAYPVGALKLIHTAGDRLGRSGRRQVHDPAWKARFDDCLQLHFVVESDILLTMDGLPSDTAFSLLAALPTSTSLTLHEVETGYMNLSVAEIAQKKRATQLTDATLALTAIQNRVLVRLYGIAQAYSQPSLLSQALSELKTELTRWFDDHLPLECHFPRDLGGALTIPRPQPDYVKYLRAKYYIIEFLMCRPILYYIAHESVEARDSTGVVVNGHGDPSTSTTTSPSNQSDTTEGRPFWIYDACFRCLQCAALLVLEYDPDSDEAETDTTSQPDWLELHIIWGAALTMVLSLVTPALAKFLPKHGQPGQPGPFMDTRRLLAKAEAILVQAARNNCVPAQCLAILHNVQGNLLGPADNTTNGATTTGSTHMDIQDDTSPASFLMI
ncbi:hypothetical protein Sste5346_002433 [Sporothrix stenoceras]|uniref:Zn(2)-C6 fungal-type domain-containing protein n=1 Tax=Sporothrix stenoceras TaxID=5173 RepID=A0ABR3ZI87_9PEZI